MLMLTSYLDETGNSADEKQEFNGMAGLLGPAENWEELEKRWKKTVTTQFKLPYIHMKEMRKLCEGWSDTKKKKLSRDLWKIIADCHLLPIGSIIPMRDYRPLEARLKKHFRDPYYIAMQNCIEFSTELIKPGALFLSPDPDTRVAIIFDDKVEFRETAKKLYVSAVEALHVQNLVDEPAFRNMRVVVPLQAADMVAYEVYKEYERVIYRHNDEARFGWQQIDRIYKKVFKLDRYSIMRHSQATLYDWVVKAEAADRLATYWEKQRAKKKSK